MNSRTNLPEGRIHQLPSELEQLYEGMETIGVGPRYMGSIRKGDWHIELGGPRNDFVGYIQMEIMPRPGDVADGRVELIGPDAREVPPETSLPGGYYFKAYGAQLRDTHSEYLYRTMILALTELEGHWCQGPRFSGWMRLSKKAIHKQSFVTVAQAVRAFLKSSVPMVEAIEARIVVGVPEVGGKDVVAQVREEYRERQQVLDAKFDAFEDEDVENFYGCTLCQTFAPNHVCVLTPSRMPYCGVISYRGAEASYEIEPTGYIFEIPRGEVIDPVLGRYTGVNEKVRERSHGTVTQVCLDSSIKYVATNCGCFEGASFYLPDVDGIGLVQRRYFGNTPLGLPFTKIAGSISGGQQVHGFKGLSVRGMMTKGFLKGDGGWERIVWMPKDLKLELAEVIPEEVYDKIATEEDTLDVNELKEFLRKNAHPVTRNLWKDGEPQPVELPLPGEDWPDD